MVLFQVLNCELADAGEEKATKQKGKSCASGIGEKINKFGKNVKESLTSCVSSDDKGKKPKISLEPLPLEAYHILDVGQKKRDKQRERTNQIASLNGHSGK